MPDYKEMYLKLFRSCTQAIHLLEEAQRETEEMFASEKEPVQLQSVKEKDAK